jgi:hypothetical protein
VVLFFVIGLILISSFYIFPTFESLSLFNEKYASYFSIWVLAISLIVFIMGIPLWRKKQNEKDF